MDLAIEQLRSLHRGDLAAAFPTIDERRATVALDGFFFRTADDTEIIQMRRNGYTFNRLPPYVGWEAMLPKALTHWNSYANMVRPEQISKVAVRCINHLRLKLPIGDFGDYLTAPPTVPLGLPQGISSFVGRVVVEDPTRGLSAMITQALDPATKGDSITVILDIEVFKGSETGFERDEIAPLLGELHELRNQAFFDSVTEKTLELYR